MKTVRVVLYRKADGLYLGRRNRSRSWGSLADAHIFKNVSSATQAAGRIACRQVGGTGYWTRWQFSRDLFDQQFEVLPVKVVVDI